MDFEKAKARAQQLRSLLNYYSRKYYADDDPVVEDREYDMLQRELLQIEQTYPELQTPDSPTVRIGGSADGMFALLSRKWVTRLRLPTTRLQRDSTKSTSVLQRLLMRQIRL